MKTAHPGVMTVWQGVSEAVCFYVAPSVIGRYHVLNYYSDVGGQHFIVKHVISVIYVGQEEIICD